MLISRLYSTWMIRAKQESLMGQIRQLEKHFSLYVDGDKRVSKMRDSAFWELMKDKKNDY